MADLRGTDRSGPTGQVWTLTHGEQVARVGQAGAVLLGYRVGGDWVTEPTAPGHVPAAGNGQLLVPWPNRVRDGRWVLDGVPQQLALTEPARSNANHGLLRHAEYQPLEVGADRVTLRAAVFAVTGYPFRLDHTVTWSLGDAGLAASHTVAHLGPADGPAAPVALGAHPYLRVGDVPVAECTLRVAASTRYLTDDRLLPLGTEPVAGSSDWRTARVVGTAPVDGCWRDLATGPDGLVRHDLGAPDGRGVSLWADPAFSHVQLFVTDRLPGRDLALAVEPMTAPADAFNSGTDLRWLAPGEEWTVSWGVTPHGF